MAALPKRSTPLAGPILLLIGLAAIALAAAAAQARFSTSPDVSWLITFSEKILDGRRPYVDVIELNPPASILLYLGPTAVARLIGLWPEFAVAAFGFASVAASLTLLGSMLSRLQAGEASRNKIVLIAAAILALLPARVFDQRDHLALVFGLPFFALLALKAEGRRTPLFIALAAGIGAGLMICVRPHLALAMIGPVLVAFRRRGWRAAASPELAAAGGVACLYGVAVVALFPAFLENVLPMTAAVYVPAREPLVALLASPGVIAWIVLALVALWAKGDAFTASFGWASVGALASYFIQGKGWPYHAYPAIALAAMAAATAWRERAGAVRLQAAPVAAALGLSFLWMADGVGRSPELEAALRRIGPHPSLLEISGDIALGHPLAREVGARWAQSVCSLWVAADVDRQLRDFPVDPLRRQTLEAYRSEDLRRLIGDIRGNRPDAILTTAASASLAQQVLSEVTDVVRYRAFAEAKGPHGAVTVLIRDDLAGAAVSGGPEFGQATSR